MKTVKMRSLPVARRKCLLCGRASRQVVEDFRNCAFFFSDDFYSIDIEKVLCPHCGLIYASKYLDPDHLKGLYVTLATGPEEISFRPYYKPGHNDFLIASLRKLHPQGPRRILDVGCGRCDTLNAFQALGWETFGVDVSPLSEEIGKAKGHRIWRGNFQDADFGGTRFDAILFEASLEHMLNPVEVLHKVSRLTTDSGHLALFVPDAYTCLTMRNPYDILREDHCNHFTLQTLQQLLSSVGFYPADFFIKKDTAVPDVQLVASKDPARQIRPESIFPDSRQLAQAVRGYGELKAKARKAFAAKMAPFKKVAVYCAGAYTTLMMPPLFGFDLAGCAYFVDNNVRKQGKTLFGRPVHSPRQLKVEPPDAVIIASEVFEDEIYGPLRKDLPGVELICANKFFGEIVRDN